MHVDRNRAYTLIPEYSAGNQLPEAVEEGKKVAELFGAKPLPADFQSVKNALKGPGTFDLLHYAGHGSADASNISEAKILLGGRMENGNFVAESITATTAGQFANFSGQNGKSKTWPIVTLNACQIGRAGYNLTGMGGFARAFINAGAGLFVGTLWEVGDQPARQFVIDFYTALKAGKTVSEAAIAARNPSSMVDVTSLSYVIYGRPDARLTIG